MEASRVSAERHAYKRSSVKDIQTGRFDLSANWPPTQHCSRSPVFGRETTGRTLYRNCYDLPRDSGPWPYLFRI